MDKVRLNYATKKIKIPSKRSYWLKLTEKIELFINRMRQKAIYFNNKKGMRTMTFTDKTNNMYRLSRD